MSQLTYNGVTLPYVMTNQFRQETVWEESGTDYYLTKFDIHVDSLLNANYIAQLTNELQTTTPGTPSIYNAADLNRVLRPILMAPRKTLSFSFNGSEQIPIISTNIGVVDSKNGPMPQSFNVVEAMNQTFLVSFHIIAHYWENPFITADKPNGEVSSNHPGGPVLYNRWSESADIDGATQLTTRTREGKYLIRSDNAEGLTVDRLRSAMAVVGVPDGFVRESSRYITAPDGLGLQYSVTDRQVFKMPPPPASKAVGIYEESSTIQGGYLRYGSVLVKLTGAADISQDDLLAAAISVGMSKLRSEGGNVQLNAPLAGGQAVLQAAKLKVNMYENEVEFSAIALLAATPGAGGIQLPGGFQGVAGFQGMKTFTPGSDDLVYQPVYRDRGSVPLLLQAAAYWDPNLSQELDRLTGNVPGVEVGQGGRVNG